MSVVCVRRVAQSEAARLAIVCAALPLAFVLAAVLLASLVAGCGASSEPPATTSLGPLTSESNPGGSPVDDWGPPSSAVIDVFAREAARVDLPIYLPSRLPMGSTVLVGGGKPTPLSEAGARSVVQLATELGSVSVAQGIEGDVGDLPGEPCGDVAGLPALVYRLAQGYLVQWSDPPWLYGVFSDTMPEDTVISLALAMARYPLPNKR